MLLEEEQLLREAARGLSQQCAGMVLTTMPATPGPVESLRDGARQRRRDVEIATKSRQVAIEVQAHLVQIRDRAIERQQGLVDALILLTPPLTDILAATGVRNSEVLGLVAEQSESRPYLLAELVTLEECLGAARLRAAQSRHMEVHAAKADAQIALEGYFLQALLRLLVPLDDRLACADATLSNPYPTSRPNLDSQGRNL
jgi:hypothetical protein